MLQIQYFFETLESDINIIANAFETHTSFTEQIRVELDRSLLFRVAGVALAVLSACIIIPSLCASSLLSLALGCGVGVIAYDSLITGNRIREVIPLPPFSGDFGDLIAQAAHVGRRALHDMTTNIPYELQTTLLFKHVWLLANT